MATKIIKAWINGEIQEIEVEDIVSAEQPLSYEDRLGELEDKPIITDGNLLVGNGTEELEEMTPEEVLSHINGASVVTITTEEYEALTDDESNANTLYLLTDSEDILITTDDIDNICGNAVVEAVTTNITLTDISTDEKYTLYIDNGKLTMEASEV